MIPKKRIFIGIKLSRRLAGNIAEWQEKNQDLKVRWLSSENTHITLLPPWLESNVDKIKEKMEALKWEIRPFTIYFDKIAFGPNPKNPRLIWVRGESHEFDGFKKKVESVFENQDLREPRPHITIARFEASGFAKFPRKELE